MESGGDAHASTDGQQSTVPVSDAAASAEGEPHDSSADVTQQSTATMPVSGAAASGEGDPNDLSTDGQQITVARTSRWNVSRMGMMVC